MQPFCDRELLKLLPSVLRARDFHLYTEGGKRLTDLWLYGGKAVLGHKPARVLKEFKNTAERGLFSPFPHPLERRLYKALQEIFPGRAFRLYPDEATLNKILEKTGPGEAGSSREPVSLWRPFAERTFPETHEAGAGASILIPILPWLLGPAVLVLDKGLEKSFPAGDIIPPVLLAPAVRALYDLAALIKAAPPNRANPRYVKIDKALKKGIWQRKGIYLTLTSALDREKYAAMFRRFLEGGFLIPPSQEDPVILPGFMSAGEEAKLAGELEFNP